MRGASAGKSDIGLRRLSALIGYSLCGLRVNATYYRTRNTALLETEQDSVQRGFEGALKTREVGRRWVRWLYCPAQIGGSARSNRGATAQIRSGRGCRRRASGWVAG